MPMLYVRSSRITNTAPERHVTSGVASKRREAVPGRQACDAGANDAVVAAGRGGAVG